MARPLKINLKESSGELQLILSRLKTARNSERIQMLYWLKLGEVSTRKQLAKLLARNESTITRWLNLYRKGGIEQLLEIKTAPGKPAKITGQVLENLKKELQKPTGFRSYGEVKDWLEEKNGVKVAYKTVHQTVRYKLEAKLKTPRPSSINKSQQGEESFKKT
ncbi:MAG: helix-turn-helix domain-containing protein [Cyanobacteriota bacterium]|nr:helix-turn-helix domain-containing protein [Cyanobacteriota bacterium]